MFNEQRFLYLFLYRKKILALRYSSEKEFSFFLPRGGSENVIPIFFLIQLFWRAIRLYKEREYPVAQQHSISSASGISAV